MEAVTSSHGIASSLSWFVFEPSSPSAACVMMECHTAAVPAACRYENIGLLTLQQRDITATVQKQLQIEKLHPKEGFGTKK